MRFFKTLIVLLFFVNSAVAELTGTAQPARNNGSNHGNCSAEQFAKNEELLSYCDANWERWGVTEKPPKNELLDPKVCNGTLSKDYAKNVLKGCAGAAMAFPALLGELAVIGMIKLTPEDKSSITYIAQNGSLQDMQAYYTNQFLREKCKLGSPEDDNRFIDSNCRKPSIERIDCNPFLDQVRAATQCRRSKETRSEYRLREKEILAQAQALFDKQQERKRNEAQHKTDLASLRNTCGPIMNPYSESYTKAFLHPLRYLGTEAANAVKPNAETVKKYNDCIAENSKGNAALEDALKKNGAGLIGDMANSIESLKCYREDIQTQLLCEVAAGVISGGTATTVFALKKLGKKAVGKALAKGTPTPKPEAPKIFPLKPATAPRTNALEEFTKATGREVELQFIPGVGDVIVDKATGKALFRLKYKVDARDGVAKFKGISAEVALNEAQDGFNESAKGNGFYSFLFNKMVTANPDVKMIQSDLWYDNLDVFRKNMAEGYSPLEAFKGTPAYRVYIQNGFTEIKEETIRVSYDSSGRISGVTATVVKP